MGEEDIRRQELNVFRMKLLGARVVPVASGSKTLKDAINEAMRDWVTNVRTTYYMLGSVLGPHPYPTMVRDFQSVIGREVRGQILEKEGRLPDVLVACVGGGSNAMGLFLTFVPDKQVRMIGAEAGGRGPTLGDHAARFSGGSPGVLHGTFSFRLELAQLLGQAVPDAPLGAEFLGLRLGQVLEPGQRFLVDGDGQLLLVRLEFLAGELPEPVRVEQRLGVVLVQPGDRCQLVALLPDVLETLPDGHQVAEFLDDVVRCGQGGGRVQDLVAEEVVDAAAEALAGLDDAQQRQGLVRIDAEQAPETLREGLVDVEDLGVREDRVQRRLGEALLRDALKSP